MTASGNWMTPVLLTAVLGALLWLSTRPRWAPVFRWLPVPLWCYAIPMGLRAAGWLPAVHPAYAWANAGLLPVALILLLLGVDLPALARAGPRALIAMVAGAIGILVGGPCMFALAHAQLPAESWKGIGALAGSWTGGSLNFVALRTILNAPDEVYAPLVVIDALVAYGWMACLVACAPHARRIDRWLGAQTREAPVTLREISNSAAPQDDGRRWRAAGQALAVAIATAMAAAHLAQALPTGRLVSSATGWTALLATTAALVMSTIPALRRLGDRSPVVGYPCLYAVLMTLGAQADVAALAATPLWLVVALGWLLCHIIALLVAGRLWRIPLALLATASQANIGGVVSAPLVGAVYHPSLASIGLVLAIAGNALGTYAGLLAAELARVLTG